MWEPFPQLVSEDGQRVVPPPTRTASPTREEVAHAFVDAFRDR